MLIVNIMTSKFVIWPAAAVATLVIVLAVRRLAESPEKKKARQLLSQVVQKGLEIIYMQEGGEALRSGIEEANRLLRESHEPEQLAQAAFKEGRYLDAQRQAEEALRLIKLAYRAQSRELLLPPPILVVTLYLGPRSEKPRQ